MNKTSLPRFFAAALLILAGLGHGSVVAAPTPATFSATIAPAAARPGETVTVTVSAKINAPFHIYSVVPVPPPGPQETTLTVTATPLTADGKVVESTPTRTIDPNFDNKEVGYHGGTATLTTRLSVPQNAKPTARVPLGISVRYMACTETSCLPPKTVDVAAPTLSITAGEARAEFTNLPPLPEQAGTAPAALGTGNQQTGPMLVADSEQGGLGTLVLVAFGAGLLALITPCVFPMIPVTLAFFTKQATGDKGGVVRLAATYSLGIVVAFTAIGGILAATVGAAGANRLAASPWVNLGFAILFVVFALALLEIFELRLPAGLQNLTSVGRKHGGTLGVLGMGLTFVIAAFTCTAPFVGTILVAASSASSGAEWVRPIVGMAAFASALALPFFVLALFPGWLAKLPRSGAWLSTVKGAMGFLELAAALKFLSNADLVWQWKLLNQSTLLALWALIAAAGALWLVGALRIGFGTPEGRPTPVRAAWAGVFAAAAVYCLYGLTGRPLQADVVAFLPPADYGIGAKASAHDELPFLDTLDKGLAQARAENKPLFVDFTGYTCTNCRWMEKNVFPDPGVKAEMERFVRVRLYTDDKNVGQAHQAYQEKTFDELTLPLYAVLTPSGTPLAKSGGITRDPRAFADFLRQGRERSAANVATASSE